MMKSKISRQASAATADFDWELRAIWLILPNSEWFIQALQLWEISDICTTPSSCGRTGATTCSAQEVCHEYDPDLPTRAFHPYPGRLRPGRRDHARSQCSVGTPAGEHGRGGTRPACGNACHPAIGSGIA